MLRPVNPLGPVAAEAGSIMSRQEFPPKRKVADGLERSDIN